MDTLSLFALVSHINAGGSPFSFAASEREGRRRGRRQADCVTGGYDTTTVMGPTVSHNPSGVTQLKRVSHPPAREAFSPDLSGTQTLPA